jgi:hypothetical protein
MISKLDESIISTLETARTTSIQVAELMMIALRRFHPDVADKIDDMLELGQVRLVTQADEIGLKLFAIDAQNNPVGGPLLTFRAVEKQICH